MNRSLDSKIRIALRHARRELRHRAPTLTVLSHRIARALPRGLPIILIGVVAAQLVEYYVSPLNKMFPGLISNSIESFSLREWTNGVRMAVLAGIVVSLLCAGTLLATIPATSLLLYFGKRKLGAARKLNHAVFGAAAFALISLTLRPVYFVAAAADDAYTNRVIAEGRAFALTYHVSRRTAARILAEADAGMWSPLPADGPSALVIKAELRSGSPLYRDVTRSHLQRIVSGRDRTYPPEE